MHELGHSLGLRPSDFVGIDSREVPYSEYRSIMNYNAPSDSVRYSDRAPFDGWTRVVSGMDAVNATALVDDGQGDDGRS
jgi:hypothetical protein